MYGTITAYVILLGHMKTLVLNIHNSTIFSCNSKRNDNTNCIQYLYSILGTASFSRSLMCNTGVVQKAWLPACDIPYNVFERRKIICVFANRRLRKD